MRISDWSSDVCSSDLTAQLHAFAAQIIGRSIAIPAFATRCGLLLTLMVVTALAIVLLVQRRGCGQFLNVPLGFRVLGFGASCGFLGSALSLFGEQRFPVLLGGERKSVVEGKRGYYRGDP